MLAAFTVAFCLLLTSSHGASVFLNMDIQSGEFVQYVEYSPTTSKVCAYARGQDGTDVEKCLPNGISSNSYAYFWFDRDIDVVFPVYLVTFGNNALWMNYVSVTFNSNYDTRIFGSETNDEGWCMSTDPEDYTGFGNHVSDECGQILKLDPNAGWSWVKNYKSTDYTFSKLQRSTTPLYPNKACHGSSQGAHLGVVDSEQQCIAEAKHHVSNGGDCLFVMFSSSHPGWGCRCCKADKINNIDSHSEWDIYSLRGHTTEFHNKACHAGADHISSWTVAVTSTWDACLAKVIEEVRNMGGCYAHSEEACQASATKAGLTPGGEGYDFAGNYNTKGCYYYDDPSSKYYGRAYFGTGGTESEREASVASPKSRLRKYGGEECDCLDFMYSETHPSWGCWCCAQSYAGTFDDHGYWDVYTLKDFP